jgi:hypothetical protein
MKNQPDFDRIRGAALDRIDQARRWFWTFFWLTALCEVGMLVTVLLLIDWSNSLHHLLLAIAVLIYMTLGLAILALGAYMNWCTQRLLDAQASH